MSRNQLLLDIRTGEGGTLDWFFRRLSMHELGRFVKPASPREIQDTKERIELAKKNNLLKEPMKEPKR